MGYLEKKAAEMGVELAEAAADEAKGIMLRLFGPIASEIGEIIALPAKETRMLRTARMLHRADEKVRAELERGDRDLVQVPARGALPLLEAASIEDDENLSDWYTDLLANAALGQGTDDLGSFAEIMRQLSPRDAQVLQLVFHHHVAAIRTATRERGSDVTLQRPSVNFAEMAGSGHAATSMIEGLHDVSCSWTPEQLRISSDNLFRLGLLRDTSTVRVSAELESPNTSREVTTSDRVQKFPRMRRGLSVYQPTRKRVTLTDLGTAFARSVNPPGLEIPEVQMSPE